MNSMENFESQEDLLSIEDHFVRADAGKRLLNYIIDFILFYLLLFALGILIAIVWPSAIQDISSIGNNYYMLDRLLSLVLYAVYMSVVEGAFKGKSLGKLITGTRAINLDGSRISFGKAFERGFSRAVPFCAFSAFGTPCNPWQDRWTSTMVIDEKKSANI